MKRLMLLSILCLSFNVSSIEKEFIEPNQIKEQIKILTILGPDRFELQIIDILHLLCDQIITLKSELESIKFQFDLLKLEHEAMKVEIYPDMKDWYPKRCFVNSEVDNGK